MIRKSDLLLLLVSFSTMGLGLAGDKLFVGLYQLAAPSMMSLLFLSFLKVSLDEVWVSLKRYPLRLIVLTIIKLGVMPMAVYWIARALFPDYALGLLLMAGTATGVTSPFLTNVVGGNVSLALVMAAVTTFVLPFSLPLMVDLLAGQNLDFDLISLARFLAVIIFVPVSIALIGRRVTPKVIDWLDRRSFPISIALFGLVNLGTFSRYSSFLIAQPLDMVWGGLMAIGLCLLGAVMAWLVIPRPTYDMIGSVASMCWINNVLIIVLGGHIGDPPTSILGALYLVPAFGLVIPLTAINHRFGRQQA